MYKLYWLDRSGAFAPEAVLAEIGAEYERIRVDYRAGENRRPDYLRINPMGQVPALQLSDGSVMTETIAMVLHLADCHPEAGLLPPPGDPARARAYRWLVFAASDLYETDLRQSYSDRYTTDPLGAEGVRTAADAHLDALWDMVEATLDSGPYLLGERFSVVDVELAMLAGWHHEPARLLARCPRVARLLETVRRRPKIAPLWQLHYGHKPIFQDA